MRASTAFKRMLGIEGLRVTKVELVATMVLISVVIGSRRPRCGRCGTPGQAVYDHRPRRRWRHLDAFGWQVFLEADLRRMHCASCQAVRTEAVPFARPLARHTIAFETAVVATVISMDKAAAARMWRISWAAVDAIVARAVEAPDPPTRLRAIGVDERSWGRNRALTVVVDHDAGRVIWMAEGTTSATLEAFFAWVGPEVAAGIEAVTMDMDIAYRRAVERACPQARICYDPFHVMRLVTKALDVLRRSLRLDGMDQPAARVLRRALLRPARSLSPAELDNIASLAGRRRHLFDAWVLKEELADLYRQVAPEAARDYLARWVGRARASKIPGIEMAAKTIARHFEGIVSAVELGLSNARLEGFNAKIALINRRGYGHRNLEAFMKTIYLCCGGVARPTSPWVGVA